MDTVESFAEVAQLETRKSQAETYQTFYKLYGEEQLREARGHLVLNRVLHFDVNDARDVHVVVARRDQSINPPIMRRYDRFGAPAHIIPYQSADFLVAATDGLTITRFDVLSVRGLYGAHLDSVTQQYNSFYEKLQLSLGSEAGQSTAEFRLATGDGVFNLAGKPIGWILSEAETVRLRSEVLDERAPMIGQVAVAS